MKIFSLGPEHPKKKPSHEAFCLVCCGGGKTLVKGNKVKCEREATSHGNAYGHNVTILEIEAGQ